MAIMKMIIYVSYHHLVRKLGLFPSPACEAWKPVREEPFWMTRPSFGHCPKSDWNILRNILDCLKIDVFQPELCNNKKQQFMCITLQEMES